LRAGVLLVVATIACSPDPPLIIPAPVGWRSAVVSIESSDGAERTAYEGGDEIRAERARGLDVEVLAAFFDQPLATLDLERGPIPVVPRMRPLPPPELGAFARAITGGVIGETETLSPSDARLTRIQIPELDAATCQRTGRCLEIREAVRSCTSDCSPDAPTLPAEPLRPTAPEPPVAPAPPVLTPCTGSWILQPTLPMTCSPPAVAAQSRCASGDAQHHGEPACRTVGSPCPAGDWPTPPVGAEVRWVRPFGGLDPFGAPAYASIPAAIASAPPGAVIALSKGTQLRRLARQRVCLRTARLAGRAPRHPS